MITQPTEARSTASEYSDSEISGSKRLEGIGANFVLLLISWTSTCD